jgi:hypothetical protein
LGERRGESSPGWLVDSDLVVAAAKVLSESVTGGECAKPGHGLDSAHRAQPPFQLRVVGLAPVIGVST